ncbi:MAG: hypothetical protein EZS28_027845 [Streblomastix strix]|uniref:Uncharacterized protein n=1 Tax=Streblomastix strix TaxID=222440 RepID=A0A5J4V1P4_9EUKA|nr:MAG: hypothetical protein EZS28_027845 [Streblomastix strix]
MKELLLSKEITRHVFCRRMSCCGGIESDNSTIQSSFNSLMNTLIHLNEENQYYPRQPQVLLQIREQMENEGTKEESDALIFTSSIEHKSNRLLILALIY